MNNTAARAGRVGLGAVLAALVVGTAPAGVSAVEPPDGATQLVTVRADGTPTERGSQSTSITGDGTWVAFQSEDPHLIAGRTIRGRQAYRESLTTGAVDLVSVDPDGAPGDGDSYYPALSDDGAVVAFYSSAHLVAEQHDNGQLAAFVRDMATGTTTLVARGRHGGAARGSSTTRAISADGRFVLFQSEASHLVAHDRNGTSDVFLLDREVGTTTLISRGLNGRPARGTSLGQSISADGRVIAFTSYAQNLVPGRSNKRPDVYTYDTGTGQTTLISRALDGSDANGPSEEPDISADGNHVAFASWATDLAPGTESKYHYKIFVTDLRTGVTTFVSRTPDGGEPNASCSDAVLSADGSVIVFGSTATDLTSPATQGTLFGSYDLYRTVVASGHLTRITRDANTVDGYAHARITDDGKTVAFKANGRLVPEDQNDEDDAYLWVDSSIAEIP